MIAIPRPPSVELVVAASSALLGSKPSPSSATSTTSRSGVQLVDDLDACPRRRRRRRAGPSSMQASVSASFRSRERLVRAAAGAARSPVRASRPRVMYSALRGDRQPDRAWPSRRSVRQSRQFPHEDAVSNQPKPRRRTPLEATTAVRILAGVSERSRGARSRRGRRPRLRCPSRTIVKSATWPGLQLLVTIRDDVVGAAHRLAVDRHDHVAAAAKSTPETPAPSRPAAQAGLRRRAAGARRR